MMISVKWGHTHDRSRVKEIVDRIKERNRKEIEKNKKKEG